MSRACLASLTDGNLSLSNDLNVNLPTFSRDTLPYFGELSSVNNALLIGILMSASAIMAILVPSFNDIIPWINDSGWTNISINSCLIPNKYVASINSSPLLIRVAESIVILFPIFHVGCFSDSSTLTNSSSSFFLSKKGPPEAVITNFLIFFFFTAPKSLLKALCSESTGSIFVDLFKFLSNNKFPAVTIDSLFAIARTAVLFIQL